MIETNLGKVALNPRGEYSSEATYTKLDVVNYNGSSYMALGTVINVLPTNTTYWLELAEKGEQGIQGVTGEAGQNGQDATINGVNTLNVVGGSDIEIEQEGNTMTINATVPKKTSDLTNDSNFAVTNANNNFSSAQTFNGDVEINGNLTQNGQSYETHAEMLFTENDKIITRDGAVGGLGENETSGIVAKLYDGTNDGELVFGSDGTARVGDSGNTQPLLTRAESGELTNGQVLEWDGINLKAKGSSNYVKKTDYATSSTGGVVKVNQGNAGLEIDSGTLKVQKATESDINAKTDNYKPIVSSSLNYAVRSVLPLVETTLQEGNTLVANTEYNLGEKTGLSFNFPSSGEVGQYCYVIFTSGSTATSLTMGGTNIVGDITIVPIANKTYEILGTYNGTNWLVQYLEY